MTRAHDPGQTTTTSEMAPETRDVAVALVGFGYWGSKLARNIRDTSGCRLAMVCDESPERRAASLKTYPDARACPSFEDALAADDIDAIVLATPASVHAEQAIAVLDADKHVFVE